MGANYSYDTLNRLAQGGFPDQLQQAEQGQRQAQMQALQAYAQREQAQTARTQRDKLQQDAQAQQADKQLKLLASVADLPEDRRAGVYAAIRPTAQRLNPAYALPDEYDEGFVQFARNQAIGPKEVAELAVKRQSAAATGDFRQQMLDLKQAALDAKAAGGPKAPSGYAFTPDGTLARIPGGPGDPANRPMTEYQGKAALYASRMTQAEPLIERFKDANTLYNKNAAAVPLAGNFLAGDDFQQLDQAKRNFINATLRQESGAAIGQAEFDNAEKQYFPQPGDGPEVIEQKRQNRALAAAQMAKAAGPGYAPPPASKAPAPAAPGGWTIERVD